MRKGYVASIAALLLVLLMAAMLVTCPDRESFVSYFKEHRLSGKPVPAVIAGQAKLLSLKYRDHKLWAVAEVGVRKKEVYLGVFGTWFKLK